jgi:hypothetical protein
MIVPFFTHGAVVDATARMLTIAFTGETTMAAENPSLFVTPSQDAVSHTKRPYKKRQPKYPHIVVDGIEMKHCGPGSHYVTLEEFYVRASRWDGLESICKSCNTRLSTQWVREHTEEKKIYLHRYYEEHKEVMLSQAHQYRKDHLEERREKERNYARDHREEKRIYKREYHKKNSEKINEKSRQAFQRYKQERPEILRAQRKLAAARRRARVEGLPFDFTEDDAAFAFAYTNATCIVCGVEEGLWNTLALDHWWPIAGKDQPSLGTVAGNIIVLCHVGGHRKAGKIAEIGGCNNSKGNRHPEEWLLTKLGAKKGKKKLKEIQQFLKTATAESQKRKEGINAANHDTGDSNRDSSS